jgi:thioredoxin reductase (NADPH)
VAAPASAPQSTAGDYGLKPVLFVVDPDPASLQVALSALSHRFGNDFSVAGETSHRAAFDALRQMAASGVPVALVLVDEAHSGFLARAHELHRSAKRVLLVDRDYSSTSPAVQAMTLGRVDYHLVRPWVDDDVMYRAVSEYLASWTREQQRKFEEFRIVATDTDRRAMQLRDVMTGPSSAHCADRWHARAPNDPAAAISSQSSSSALRAEALNRSGLPR